MNSKFVVRLAKSVQTFHNWELCITAKGRHSRKEILRRQYAAQVTNSEMGWLKGESEPVYKWVARYFEEQVQIVSRA
jgi:hypothetical protein